MKLRVLTINVFNLPFISPSNRRRTRLLARLVRKYNPDILAFQEFFIVESRKKFLSMVDGKYKTSLEPLRYRRFISKKMNRHGGLLVMSKYRIRKSSFNVFKANYPLRKFYEKIAQKGFIESEIRAPLTDIQFINCHLCSDFDLAGHSIRTAQLRQMTDAAARHQKRNQITLIAGDFNFLPGTSPHDFMKRQGYTDTFDTPEKNSGDGRDYTYIFGKRRINLLVLLNTRIIEPKSMRSRKSRRLDYIFIKKNRNFDIKVMDARVVFHTKEEKVSDHYGYLVDLDIKKKKTYKK